MNMKEKIQLDANTAKLDKILGILGDLIPRVRKLEERTYRIKQANGRKLKKFMYPPTVEEYVEQLKL